jgi:hypothetical protein
MVLLDILSLFASQIQNTWFASIVVLLAVMAAFFAWGQCTKEGNKPKERKRGEECNPYRVSFKEERCVQPKVCTPKSPLRISTTPTKIDTNVNDRRIWNRLYNELRTSGVPMKRIKGGKAAESLTLHMNDDGQLSWRRRFPHSTNVLHVTTLKEAFVCSGDGQDGKFILSFSKKILHLETANRDKAAAYAIVEGLLSLRNEFNGSMLQFASRSSSSSRTSSSVYNDDSHSVSDTTCTTTMTRTSSSTTLGSGAIADALDRFGTKIRQLRRRVGSSRREIKVIEPLKVDHADFD